MSDPYEILREAAKLSEPGYKNSRQMFEDFRNVFFSTPAGKRVFNQIMEEAGYFRSLIAPGDPYMTHVKLGERNLGAFIWAACVKEPKDLPTKQVRRGKDG